MLVAALFRHYSGCPEALAAKPQRMVVELANDGPVTIVLGL